jgi:hypothetical protein
MASTYLSRTPSGASNRKTFTISAWIKRSNVSGSNQVIYDAGAANPTTTIRFSSESSSDNKLNIFHYSGSFTTQVVTNREFRDTSAWYHIVVAFDTTQATASNRIKVYVNGVQETSFATATYPSQNFDTEVNNNSIQTIGSVNSGGDYFDGYISHLALVDGQALAPTVFGETDSTSGIWKFKSPSGVTWGTNGFHLKFENSGALGTDSSGNSNTFTVNGNLKQSLDTPSNVYSTINGLYRSRFSNQATLTNGNLTMTTGPTDGDKALLLGTQGVTKGKWYWECKVGADRSMIGFAYDSISRFSDFYGSNSPSDGFSVYGNNGNVYYDGANTAYGSTWTTNDIIMVALDMDNKLAWLGKNGTWMNSATQTEIENGTATYDLTTKMGTKQNLNSGEPVFPLFADMTGTGDMAMDINFGSGFFGTTAITSAGSNGNGSLFEYDVPNGYYALNTKNINTYG